MLLGLGAGWLAEEFQALGMDFARRGSAVEGGLRLLREAWKGQPAPGTYGPVDHGRPGRRRSCAGARRGGEVHEELYAAWVEPV